MITRSSDESVHTVADAGGCGGRRTGAGELAADYDSLTAGQVFQRVEYTLDAATVDLYVAAVGASHPGYVPPLAVAARAIASLGGLIALPPGTIHASQEFEFSGLVPVGARVSCQATVVRKLARGPMRMLTLETVIDDEDGRTVQKGRSTIVLPG